MMTQIDAMRLLLREDASCQRHSWGDGDWRAHTNEVRISPKNQNPSKVCRTPRAAEEVMWVTGEVTLTESNPATPMRKPKQPCGPARTRHSLYQQRRGMTAETAV
jgi:hypothetical protein